MALMSTIEWETCLLEPRPDPELARRIRRETRRVFPALAYFAPVPELSRQIARCNLELRTHTHLAPHVADLVGLVVSQDNSCRYCFAYQRAILRSFGYREEYVRRLEQDYLTAAVDARERAAMDFARRVSRSIPLPREADKQPLRAAGFDEREIRELVAQIGIFVFHNRLATLPALPVEEIEALPDTWYARLARPLVARWLRSGLVRGVPTRLRPEQRTGPFAALVEGFDGLSFAGMLRELLDAVLREGALRRRTKALVFAVVARALGCARCEAEAASLVVADGLPVERVAAVLAHLAAPELDSVESQVLPFARDTVWYGQVTPLQRRARELRSTLSLEQVLELIVTASLANMVCRLPIALPEDARV